MTSSYPILTVVIITYKHENYIVQCVENVVLQKTKFSFEIIISDDASPDNTRTKVDFFLNTNQSVNKIKYYKHDRNIGVVNNFEWALNKCNGQFIAICEGDDFWIDVHKLEKQVSFLEKNQEYVACFHNALIKKGDEIIGKHSQRTKSEEISIEDIISVGGGIYPTASLVFRNPKHFDFPKLDAFISGDRLLALNLINYGKFYYFSDCMSVYRVHAEGVYSSILNDNNKKAKVHLSNIQLLDYFEKKYFPKFQSAFKKAKSIQSRYYILRSQNRLWSLVKYAKLLTFEDFYKLLRTTFNKLVQIK